jgi:tetratricopeptide (TPR) repeat protein
MPQKLWNRLALLALPMMVLSAVGCGGAEARKSSHMEKGRSFMAAANYEKARVEFQNALQIAPTDAEARYENGVVDEKLGKPREALAFYQGAIDVDAHHAGARAKLARLYLFAGAPARALDLIQPAITEHPDDAELLTVRAAVRVQQKELPGALTDAERAVELAPNNEDSVAVLCGLYTSMGEIDKARVLLEKSIRSIPESVDLRLVLARIYSMQNNLAGAEALLSELVRLQPQERAHRMRLAQFYVRANRLDAADRTLRDAVKAMPADDEAKLALIDFIATRRSPAAAEVELKQYISADEKSTNLKFALAKFYENSRQPVKAESIYQRVIDAEKFNAAGLSARDRLAMLHAQRDDSAGAMSLLAEVLAKSPRDDDALLLRGNIALAKKDPRSAIADLRSVLRDQPNAVGVLRTLARAHLANGEPAIAEETLRGAVEGNSKDSGLRLDYAKLLAETGKSEQSKAILIELTKEHPNDVDALDTEFRVSMVTKDLLMAKSAADAIVAMRPKSAVGYRYQGMVAEASDQKEDAIRLYAAAVSEQPDALEPLQDEVRLLVAAKRSDEAIRRLEEMTVKYPDNPLGPDAKGEVLLRQGKNAAAQAAFKVAIARSSKWWVAYRDLALAQIAVKDNEGAIATLRSGESAAELVDPLSMELAGLLQRQGKSDEAIAQYEEILKRNPSQDVAANNLAMLLASSKLDAASLDRAKALTIRFAESTNPSFLDTYGWVLYKRGEAAASVPVLERAVAKVPSEAIPHYHLGMAQSQLGSRDDARQNLAIAVNSGTQFLGLDEAKTALGKLAELPRAATPKT